jgi:hypothetical protein
MLEDSSGSQQFIHSATPHKMNAVFNSGITFYDLNMKTSLN